MPDGEQTGGDQAGAQGGVTGLVQGRDTRAELVRTWSGGGWILHEEQAGFAHG